MYIPKHNAFFIHIPKTGGNSIEFFFLRDMNVQVSTENSKNVFIDHKDLVLGNFNGVQTAHYKAQQLQQNEKFCNSNYRFTIVRHPVERFLSEYAWRNGNDNGTKLDRLLNELVEQKDYRLHSCWEYITVDNKLCVDDVFRLEDISNMEKTLSKKLGIPFVMPHDNKSKKEKPTLTKSQLDIIRRVWAKDFEEFGYEINH